MKSVSMKVRPNTIPPAALAGGEMYIFYTIPWAFMASATFRKPAMLAPAT